LQDEAHADLVPALAHEELSAIVAARHRRRVLHLRHYSHSARFISRTLREITAQAPRPLQLVAHSR
jgi:hypothetical protein